MKILIIYLLDRTLRLLDDVYKDNPEEIVTDSEDFLNKIGIGILNIYGGLFHSFKLNYVPLPKINDINKEDLIIDTVFPYRSGLTEPFFFKELNKKDIKHKDYLILGIYPGTMWFKTDYNEFHPYINGTADSKIALVSLQTFFKNDLQKLLTETIIISCHELGHTLGLVHHDNCIMSKQNKANFFCQRCRKTLKVF